MNRRDFLRRSAIVAAGVVAADQLEILDRIGWTRSLFPSAELSPYGTSVLEQAASTDGHDALLYAYVCFIQTNQRFSTDWYGVGSEQIQFRSRSVSSQILSS